MSTAVRSIPTRPAPNVAIRFPCDEFTQTDWNRLCDIELALHGSNPKYQQIEWALCSKPVTNNPRQGFLYFLPRYWWLVDKDLTETRCIPNKMQREYIRDRRSENVILKYRKGGASTIIDAMYYWLCLFRPNFRAFVMAHVSDSTDELYERIKYAHDRMPEFLKQPLRVSNKKDLQFDHNSSRLRVMTAGGRGLGRAGDADAIHLSEFAFYPHIWRVMTGLVEARRNNAIVDIESTPNGWNEFKTVYQEARGDTNDRRAFFFPWYSDDANRIPVFEPLTLNHEERALVESRGLDDGQIAWRRDKQHRLGDLWKQEHPEDDETCFVSSGSPKFDGMMLKEFADVIDEEVEPVQVVRSGPMAGFDMSRLTVWDEPRTDWKYIIGADVAEGLENGNYSAAGVLGIPPHDMPEQVAAWHGHISPEDFGTILARLGWWYEDALVAVERNNHGHSTLNTLQRQIGYRPLYKHTSYNQRRGGKRREKKLGWPTDPATRPILLDGLRDALVNQSMVFRDLEFIRECMTFESGDEFKSARDELAIADMGQAKRYNDRVFAWGIAYQVYLKKGRSL